MLTSVNDPDKHIRIVYVGHPDVLWQSSRCYVCECRVPLLEGVRIGETRHVYSWGNPDEVNLDENVCHASSGDVCHMWGGVPTTSTQNVKIKNHSQRPWINILAFIWEHNTQIITSQKLSLDLLFRTYTMIFIRIVAPRMLQWILSQLLRWCRSLSIIWKKLEVFSERFRNVKAN